MVCVERREPLQEDHRCHDTSIEHFQSDVATVFPPRVRAGGAGTPCRAPCPRLYLLGSVRGHAVLSSWASPVAARDLRRAGCQRRQAAASGIGRRAQPLHSGLCQRASPLATVSQRVLSTARSLPRSCRRPWFPFQKPTAGTSANALEIQIWTALIALLLLKYLQLRARFGWSLSNLAALLRQQLFVYRDLWEWIHQPFQPPPLLAAALEQGSFSWSGNLDSRTTTSTAVSPLKD